MTTEWTPEKRQEASAAAKARWQTLPDEKKERVMAGGAKGGTKKWARLTPEARARKIAALQAGNLRRIAAQKAQS